MDIEELRKEIPEYEKELPIPYAFKKLVSIFRRLGKHAKKNGEFQDALMYFNHMLSLSELWHRCYGTKTSGIEGREVDRAEKFLQQFKAKHGTFYPFTYQKDGAVANDVLLSATDYKNLQALSNIVYQNPPTEKPTRTSKKAKITRKKRKASVIRLNEENGIKVRWIEGKKVTTSSKKAVYQGTSGNSLTIELYVLGYYQSLGYSGYWSENEYWWAIMALLFWDVIFARLPGVYTPEFGPFPSQMQDMPRDFFSADFYPRRRNLIEKRISELTRSRFFGLQQPDIEAELKSAVRKHKGQPCRPINWEKYSTVDSLLLAAKSLSSVQLVGILKRLLRNFNENRRGMPDLFMVNGSSPIFVEVKSERERVADYQIKWMTYLKNEIEVSVEICRVVNTAR